MAPTNLAKKTDPNSIDAKHRWFLTLSNLHLWGGKQLQFQDSKSHAWEDCIYLLITYTDFTIKNQPFINHSMAYLNKNQQQESTIQPFNKNQ